jgi:hypothetical protein
MRRPFAVALVALLATAAAATAHEGNPNFRSTINGLSPAAPGINVQVLNLDDRLELVNRGDQTVVVEGYDNEPYARVQPDGTVEVNRRSPAAYLNDDRFAQVDVPASADAEAPPRWETIDRTGRFEWHDHRIHWMAKTRPPAVKDPDVRTKVFDWEVPLRVGDQPVELAGTLTWVGKTDDGGAPVGAIVAFAAVVVGGAAAVIVARRRRRRAAPEGEAW